MTLEASAPMRGGLRGWVKARRHPVARIAYTVATVGRLAAVPLIPGVHPALYKAREAVRGGWAYLVRATWHTPLFQSRLTAPARDLFLYGGMPQVLGPVAITIGRGCRISGQVTITGRHGGATRPQLILGRNIDLGWQTTVAVGRRIEIGDNVRIAGRAFLAGYPGHPLDPEARALGLPETEDQVGDIILERDVWLATGVTVSAGVTIGAGTVVAAGSVVTKDLPPNVLAGGVPARVIRPIAYGGMT